MDSTITHTDSTNSVFKIKNHSRRYCDGFSIKSVLRLDTTIWILTLKIHAKNIIVEMTKKRTEKKQQKY